MHSLWAETAWKTSLKKQHSELRSGIIIANVLPALRPLLTDVKYLCVDEKVGTPGRVDELVKILLIKDHWTFDRFCFALERNSYSHWASKLRGNDERFPASFRADALHVSWLNYYFNA